MISLSCKRLWEKKKNLVENWLASERSKNKWKIFKSSAIWWQNVNYQIITNTKNLNKERHNVGLKNNVNFIIQKNK